MMDKPIIDENKLITIIGLEDGQPSVMQVEKEGRIYIHGNYVHRNLDSGKLEGNYWLGKEDKSKNRILKGAHWQLIDQYCKWRVDLQAYEDKQRKARYGYERESYKWVSAQMGEWEKSNPRPINPLKS